MGGFYEEGSEAFQGGCSGIPALCAAPSDGSDLREREKGKLAGKWRYVMIPTSEKHLQ